MTDHLSDFQDAMRAAGVIPTGPLHADGKLHRIDVHGDRPRSANGWYVLHIDNDFAAGTFGSWKLGISQKWHSRQINGHSYDAEQRAAWARQARLATAERKRVAAEAAVRAQDIWDKARRADDGHEYLRRKGIGAHIARLDKAERLVIPVRSADGSLQSLQFIGADGSKKFLTGGAVAGGYCNIGRYDPARAELVITEGYATAATIHEATGMPVVVCFSAGNMRAVAGIMRGKYPDARIYLAGDDDRGTVGNPGQAAAGKSAQAVGGIEVMPPDGITGTDFNDLARERGIDAVRECFERAAILEGDKYRGSSDGVEASASPEPKLESLAPLSLTSAPTRATVPHAAQPSEHAASSPDPSGPLPGGSPLPAPSGPPIALGHDSGYFYYYSRETRQISELSADGHKPRNLQALASEAHYWSRTPFHNDKTGVVNYHAAADELMTQCKDLPVYSAANIRGRGAWLDEGRAVVHLGNRLIVDGATVPLSDPSFRTKYIYPAAATILSDMPEPLPDVRARGLTDICNMIRWEDPLHGRLLAGWIALAPICGALRWRPSVWLTGSKGSGKSYVFDEIVRRSLSGTHLFVGGASTEAGIRQEMKSDALPIVFEEAEAEGPMHAARMANILGLMRHSASEGGAAVLKGTTTHKGRQFLLRSMWAFASINPGVKELADESRVALLPLRAPAMDTDEDAAASAKHFAALRASVAETITDDFSSRLLMRSASLIPTIRKNAETFAVAAALVFRDRRAGDQVGALLAGAYSLHCRNEVTPAAALDWIREHGSLRSVTTVDSDSDETRFVSHIKETMVSVTRRGAPTVQLLLGEVMDIATGEALSDVSEQDARGALLRYGIRYNPPVFQARTEMDTDVIAASPSDPRGFWFSSTSGQLLLILRQTPWGAGSALRTMLNRLSGGRQMRAVKFGSGTHRAAFVPYGRVM